MEVAWPPEHLISLVAAIEAKECVLFLGAGPSSEADYPTLRGLCSLLAEKCTDVDLYRSEVCVEARALAAENGPLLLEWLHRQQPGRWIQTLQQVFPARTLGNRHSAVHELLLALPFVGYVTTNYDMCMEDAAYLRRRELAIRSPEVFSYPQMRLDIFDGSSPKFIYHIHGSAQNVNDIVLTPSQYHNAYAQTGLPQLLERIFSSYVVLFVGFSLGDLEIVRVLEKLGHAYRDEHRWAWARERYALVSKDASDHCTSIREQVYLDSIKTHVIYYPEYPTGDSNQYGHPIADHRELAALLAQLQAPFGEDSHE